MMGIYIKGMEMPKSCEKCPLLDYEEGFCLASGVKRESGWYESVLCPGSIKDGRHDDCPLVPVPPHGRLIDADALYTVMKKERDRIARDYGNNDEHVQCLTKYAISMVHCAPTIIPAEEAEEAEEGGANNE